MKTIIKLLAIVLTIASTLNPLLAQTQIGQQLGGISSNSLIAPSLSFDGSRMAVGIIDGGAKVYELVGENWVQIGSDISYGNRTALVSLSADGNRLGIIGVSRSIGQVYDLVNGNWVQVGGDIDMTVAGASTFNELALSPDGSRIVFGSWHEKTRIFELSGGDWVQVGTTIDQEAFGDSSGSSVSLSWDGSVVAVGARFNDGNGRVSGNTRIFEFISSDWVQIGAGINGEYPGDESGTSVALSADGNRVVIGAPENFGSTGHARVYERVGDSWVQLGEDIMGNNIYDRAGRSVTLSADGNKMAISSPSMSIISSKTYVQVYEWVGGEWVKISGDICSENPEHTFGANVALSGDGNSIGISSFGTEEPTAFGYVGVYNPLITLPVELTDFKGKAVNKEVVLSWTTASETNNKGFDIEHSTNANNWKTLGFVHGQGTSLSANTYTYTHTNPVNGINYYRLKQLDMDGNYDYSNVINVNVNTISVVDVFPNPTHGSIAISGIEYDSANITDTSGRSVLSIKSTSRNIDVSHLANGIYFIEIISGNNRMMKKIIKK